MRGSKIPVQELWLKMGRGRIREGGVIAGFYGTFIVVHHIHTKFLVIVFFFFYTFSIPVKVVPLVR